MATYQYIARTSGGQETRGIMQADSEAVVLRTLDERALFPVRVVERRAKRVGLRANIRMRDVATTYGQLADLLNAGVPLLRAMDTLIRAAAHRQLAQVITRVRDAVSEGKALAEAMADHPRVFPPLHAAMVRAGERGGFLEDVLTNLSEYLDRVDDLRSRVRGALIYPLVLTVLGMGAMLVVLLWLVPQFRTVFENVPLPAPTRLLFAVSDLLLHQWPLLLGGLLLAVMGIVALLRRDAGARWWDRWRLKIPLVGNLVRTVAITRFCRILGTLLHNGVAILQSLAISKDAAGSAVLAESIEKATESVRAGEKLADPLSRSGLFPAEVVEMISVAEESNQLEKVLLQIADTIERRADRRVEVMVRLVEPLILVVIAGVIGFVALGLFYPIFSLSKALK